MIEGLATESDPSKEATIGILVIGSNAIRIYQLNSEVFSSHLLINS